ncbi:MAG: M24 family metallopeptidase [Alphaproteobacteria bacterium]
MTQNEYGLTEGPAPKNRTTDLQNWLSENDFAGFLMIRTDEFQGEYLPAYAERLHWLTGFSGSAGVVVVGTQKSAIFVDGRYTVQIKKELDYDLYQKCHLVNEPAYQWIVDNFKSGDVIAYDSWLFTPNQIAVYEKALSEKGIVLQATENPIDLIWENQPAPPVGKVEVFPMEYAGVSHNDKIEVIAKSLKQNNLDCCVLTMSCSIAWLFNIRGSDVPFNPVMLSYAIVNKDATAVIYADTNKIDDTIVKHLGDKVKVVDFTQVGEDFTKLSGNVGVDMGFTPLGLVDVINDSDATVVSFNDMARHQKVFKNEAEQQAMRDCHIRDGAVMTRMLHWIDTTPIAEQNEWVNARKLEEFRSNADKFKDFSFDTISGFGENGAICHYRVSEESSLQFTDNNLYLLDSGTQYEDGTTDITRTMPIGTPTEEQKQDFTLVLQGLIALTVANFPMDYTAEQIDCIARAPLFKHGKNYDHGTGHGVGCALNVHEGPLYMSYRGRGVLFGEGAIISNEPGYYKAGEYGIRLENLMIAQKAKDGWFEWENITWCPIDTRMVNVEMLSSEEIDWLNNYHTQVWEKISPLLKDEPEVYNWLMQACEPV